MLFRVRRGEDFGFISEGGPSSEQGRTWRHNTSEAQFFAGLWEGSVFNISKSMILLLSLLLAL